MSADSLSICLAACLNAFDTFGFECESVMYYPVDSECILNTEDRLDRPDLFIDELEDNVIYLDNNCAGCALDSLNIYILFLELFSSEAFPHRILKHLRHHRFPFLF